MSAVISAIDNYQANANKFKLGENGHSEYAWSKDNIEEQILQLSFQLVRTTPETVETLANKFRDLLRTLDKFSETSELGVSQSGYYIDLLYRLMAQTRDIVDGKGEYALAYAMMWAWYTVFPNQAIQALDTWVLPMSNETKGTEDGKNKGTHPLGSWKDLKNFAYYIKTKHGAGIENPLIQKIIRLINTQLRADMNSLSEGTPVTLCAKWVPREGAKKHKELYYALARNFYPEIMATRSSTSNTGLLDTSYGGYRRESPLPKGGFTGTVGSNKAMMKTCMMYRTMLAQLNRYLDTVQIKQCANTWSTIDHAKTTSITLTKQKKAFLNLTKKGEPRSEREDRIQCAENFTAFVESRVKDGGKEINGKRVGLEQFTKQAMAIEDQTATSTEARLLDSQWRDHGSMTGQGTEGLGNIIAMVDTSGSMDGDPLHAAIALGIRVAEKSVIGRRVLTFSSKPTWHDLEHGCEDPDGKPSFCRMVQRLRNSDWGMSTNFYAAMDLILDALVEGKVDAKDAKGMVLAIFSDMQIDVAHSDKDSRRRQCMYDGIVEKYRAAGYEAPHILFWNLRSTGGFPCMSSTSESVENTTMMSGFSAALLNSFCDKGIEALQSYTPWSMLVESLMNERYSR
jgi:Domain of unknown function (DUF2828)